MAKQLKIAMLCLALLVVVFGVVVGISYLPRRVQQDFYGLELLMIGNGEYEILQTMNVSIDGKVRYGMFAKYPWFDGSIEVSAYYFTLDNPNLSIPFINGFAMGGPMMHPVLTNLGSTRIETLGIIYTNKGFTSLVIHITEWVYLGGGSSQGQQGNRLIIAPTIDTNIALELLHLYGFRWIDGFGMVHQS